MHYQVPQPECVERGLAQAFNNGLDHESLYIYTNLIHNERLRKLSRLLICPRQLPTALSGSFPWVTAASGSRAARGFQRE